MSIPEWKDCLHCIEVGMPEKYRQGMVLEEDYHTPEGEPLDEPRRRYRCQDCNRYEEITDER